MRVDRIELSKNLLRGFLAFDDLLETRPEWRGRVVFGAFVYPSARIAPRVPRLSPEVDALARRINESWAHRRLDADRPRHRRLLPASCAALRRYDVLLVNPVRDGLNLVAKEGSVLNERNGVLALSREAGVWEELQDGALDVNPFDVAGTADVLAEALGDGRQASGPARADILRAAALAAHARTTGSTTNCAPRRCSLGRSPRKYVDDRAGAVEESRRPARAVRAAPRPTAPRP